MNVTLPDGTVLNDVPDGTSQAAVTAKLAANGYDVSKLGPTPNQPVSSNPLIGADAQKALNYTGADARGGFLRGAGDIGATIMRALPNALGGDTAQESAARRANLDPSIAQFTGGDTNSLGWGTAKVGAGVAGTAGLGGLLGKGVTAAAEYLPEAVSPLMSKIASALTSGGFSTGAPPATTALGSLGNAAIRLGGGAVNGAATAGAINPSDAGTGALIGAAIPAAAKVAGSIGNGIYNAVKPVTNPSGYAAGQVADKLGPDVQSVIDKLRNSPELVQGSLPTSAQVSQNPVMTQMEKALGNVPDAKTLFAQRELSNNNARWQALRDVAGQPGQLDGAIAARGKTASDLYGKAFKNGPDMSAITPEIQGQVTDLLQRPAMISAMKDAKSLAANEGIELTNETSVQGLHYAKMALDDQIGSAVRTGNNNLVRVLTTTKTKLLNVMDSLSPEYAAARAQYATMSGPINTMEAGNSIGTKLSQGALDSGGNPIITLPGYKGAFAQAAKNAEFGISPEGAQKLSGIGADLQRSSISNSIKSPGSDTAYNLNANGWLAKALYGDNFQGAGKLTQAAAAGVGSFIPGVGTLGGWLGAKSLGGGVGTKLNSQLAEMLLNPEKLGNALTALQRQSAPNQLLLNALKNPALRAAPAVLSAQ